MKFVVTGGAGFIGSHLVDVLLGQGHTVHVIDNLSSGRVENVNPHAVLHPFDIRSEEAKTCILALKPDVVFHQAAQVDVVKSIRDPAFDAAVNIGGTLNVLDACAKVGAKLVYASSSAVYGDVTADVLTEEQHPWPISFYGISKLTPEFYIRVYHELYGLPYTILRYANVYGPRQSAKGEGGVVAIFLHRIRNGQPLLVHGDGEQTRDFVFVQDVANANLAAARQGDGLTLQVGTSSRTSVNTLVNCLQEIHGKPIRVERHTERPGDIRHSCLSNDLATQHLQWMPQFDLPSGLHETYMHIMNSELSEVEQKKGSLNDRSYDFG